VPFEVKGKLAAKVKYDAKPFKAVGEDVTFTVK
jgi:hypothetical protein